MSSIPAFLNSFSRAWGINNDVKGERKIPYVNLYHVQVVLHEVLMFILSKWDKNALIPKLKSTNIFLPFNIQHVHKSCKARNFHSRQDQNRFPSPYPLPPKCSKYNTSIKNALLFPMCKDFSKIHIYEKMLLYTPTFFATFIKVIGSNYPLKSSPLDHLECFPTCRKHHSAHKVTQELILCSLYEEAVRQHRERY